MDINKKNRVELKNYFKKNAIPTESNFADLIDAGVNQKEDGLYKPAGEPLHLEASSASAKAAIRLYETFTGNPSWAVSLYEPAALQSAFVVSDAAGNTRLWIGAADGIVHVGSPATPGALTVGSLASTGAVTAGSINTTGTASTGALTVTSLTSTGTISAAGAISANGGLTVPAGKTLTVNGTLAAGTTTATGLTVTGGLLSAGQISASGLVTANADLRVPSGTLAVNAIAAASGTLISVSSHLLLGIQVSPVPLTVWGMITAAGGLTVPSGQTVTINGTLNANGAVSTGALTAGGALNANGGISIPGPYGLSVGGSITASTITASGLTAGGLTVNGTLTANGPLSTSGTVTMYGNDITIKPLSRAALRLDKNLSQHAATATIPASIAFDTGVTIQAWIFLYVLEDNARIIDFGNGAGSNNIIFHTYADGSLGAQVYRGATAGTAFKSSSGLLTVGTWAHVAMTVDNTGVIKLYKDGALVSTSAASSANIPIAIQRTSNYVGRSSSSGHPYYSGAIADLSVWTGVRPVSTAQPVGNETGLIGYWPAGLGDYCTNADRLGTLLWYGNPRYSWAMTYDRGKAVEIGTEDWSGTTLLGAWAVYSAGYNAPGFFKDSFEVVHLRGVLAPGTSGSAAFNLPQNYRPGHTERHPIAASTSGCYVDIVTGGNVIPYLSGTPTWISLDGITFRAYQ